jgi:hypothetical protein
MNSPLNQFDSSLGSILNPSWYQQQQQSTGATEGALPNETASVMNTGQTTSTTSGALTGAAPSAGMLSGVDAQGVGDVESRITALEQKDPSNTLGNAQPVFNPQAQQASQEIFGTYEQRQNSLNSLNPGSYSRARKQRFY